MTTARPYERLALISLSVALSLQAMRAFFTLVVYNFGEKYGQTLSTVPGALVFLAPFLTPLLARAIGARRALLASLSLTALLRLALQLSPSADVSFVLSALATALALMAFTLGVAWERSSGPDGGHRFMVGILLGMAVDTGLHSAFLTWDYLWQRTAIPVLLALLLTALALYLLLRLRSTLPLTVSEPELPALLPLALLGPYFMLQIVVVQNVAFAASMAGFSLAGASALVLLGDTLALLAVIQMIRRPASRALYIALSVIMVAALVTLFTGARGLIAALVILVIQTQAGILAAVVLMRRAPAAEYPTVWRTSVAAGIGSLLLIMLAILYYVSYNISLPFSNAVLPIVAGILLAVASLSPFSQTPTAGGWRPALVPLALLVVPLGIAATQPALPTEVPNSDSFRLVDYNIHQAINTDGWLDPESTAQVIEAQNPHVVVLQEVTRGWVISGSLDAAEWLSRRLDMPYYYAPAADGQFGNLILTRIPVVDWTVGMLPRGGVPMSRSYLRANLDLGAPVTVIATHLHHLDPDTAVRIPQVERLVEVWANQPRTLIAGDMNARPGEDDVTLFERGGLISAQDATGSGDLLTFNSTGPFERIDWIFGSPDVEFSDFVIPPSTASDHLPLAVTVTFRDEG